MQKPDVAHSTQAIEGEDPAVIGRIQALQLLGSLGVGVGLGATSGCQSDHDTTHSNEAQAKTPRTLSESDFRLLVRLTETIIPKTDTAGAIEAGVPDFVDAALSAMSPAQLAALAGSAEGFWDNLPALFAEGFRWIEELSLGLHGKSFLELGDSQQFTLLESAYAAAETDNSFGRRARFLRALKHLTAEAYYTSQEGLINELGYKGNMALEMSKLECTPPRRG